MTAARRLRRWVRRAFAPAIVVLALLAASVGTAVAVQPQNPVFTGTQTWPHFFEVHVASYAPTNRIIVDRLDKGTRYASQPGVAAGDYLVRVDSTGVVRTLDGKLAFWASPAPTQNLIRFIVAGDTFDFTPGPSIPEKGGSAPSGNGAFQQNPNDDAGAPKPHFYPEVAPNAPIDFEAFIGATCHASDPGQFINIAPAWADLNVVSSPGPNAPPYGTSPLPGSTPAGFYRLRLNPDGSVAVLAGTSPISFTALSAGGDIGQHDLGVSIMHSCDGPGDTVDILGFNQFPSGAAVTCNQPPVQKSPTASDLNDGFLCYQAWGGEFDAQGDAGYAVQPYGGGPSTAALEFAGCNYIVMVPTSKPAEIPASNASVCPGGPSNVQRLFGDTRFATAAAASTFEFPNGSAGALVATGASPFDALAGGPAGAVTGAPIELVERDGIPAATEQELRRLQPRTITVLGGPGAVPDAVLAQLRGLAGSGAATRIAGNDRYETAAAISAAAFAPGVPIAFVATGEGFADALAAGAAGGAVGGPVLLVRPDAIPSPTAAELSRLQPQSIVVLGGPAAVSDAVVAQLHAFTAGPVTRAAGGSRFDTAVALSQLLHPGGAKTVFVATGFAFPDALAGGPVAGRRGAPLLLIPGSCLPHGVAGEMKRLGADTMVILGGPNAVASPVESFALCSS